MGRIGIFTLFTYGVSAIADKLLNKIIADNKLKNIILDNYDMTFVFENDITVRLWNHNKWYAWACRGVIQKKDRLVFSWDDERPRRKTMNKILKLADRFFIDNINGMV